MSAEFQSQQSAVSEGQKFNAGKVAGEFYTKRIYMDTARSFNDLAVESHHIPGPIKSIWISNASDPNFIASIKMNPDRDQGDALPLRLNQTLKFPYPMASAAIAFAAQAGKWIEVSFSPSVDLDIGSIYQTAFMVSDGNSFDNNLVSMSATPAVLVASALNRKAKVFNYSNVTLYAGASARVAHATYKTICFRIEPGAILEWSNVAALYARTETATTTEVVVVTELI